MEGFEPTTFSTQDRHSTTELHPVLKNFGSSGIRTHGFFKASVFKTGTINHSDILPKIKNY
jgi:hypothetical protein